MSKLNLSKIRGGGEKNEGRREGEKRKDLFKRRKRKGKKNVYHENLKKNSPALENTIWL